LNFSGLSYKVADYGVSRETETIDYDELQKLAENTGQAAGLRRLGLSAHHRFQTHR
jgi:glycine/serine hydroxymethyltransferase